MLIRSRKPWMLTDNDVTSETAYRSRREIMAAGALGLAATALPAAARAQDESGDPLSFMETDYTVDDQKTVYEAVTGYNNFYEFGTGKSDPARYAHNMITDPWSVEVDGACMNPGTVGVEDLVDFSALEERVYRLRCVEAWSMVIPWVGVPLSSVLAKFEPTSNAKYVAFETLANPEQMRGVRGRVLEWPYVEGLRIDEAMHPLTFMAVGLYGKTLLNQNGAPMRLVVPWKYGFKSIKSIVRISFVEEQPPTSWGRSQPREYGFYSNVNPEVRHPRWSQAHEDFIIDQRNQPRRDTEMFNGYAEEVAHLYEGMDLTANF